MNIERYIMPVVIAAGLHGALLLSFIEPGIVYPPSNPKTGPGEKPPVPERIEIIPENSATGSAGETAGGPDPLPRILDLPRELPKVDIFTVLVTDTVVPLRPLTTLMKIPQGVGEPGDGKGPRTGLSGAIQYTNLDNVPRATVRPAPNYPDTMSKSDTDGAVTVEFVVDTTGRVVSAEAVRWTHREFVDPAVRAVLRWRFEPGTHNGRKVSFRMAVPIEFYATL